MQLFPSLKALGYATVIFAHPNMLLHSQRHIKLADFDRTVGAGDNLDAATDPFTRILGEEGG